MNRMNPCNSRNCITGNTLPATADRHAVSERMTNCFPLAMAYVPKQHYHQMFDLDKGLRMGTIFPELCLPFCGVRRNCACRTTK